MANLDFVKSEDESYNQGMYSNRGITVSIILEEYPFFVNLIIF